MRTNFIYLIFVTILIFSSFLISESFGFESPNESAYSIESYYWGPIEIISEPIPGLNNNIGDSRDSDLVVENGNIYAVWTDVNNTNGAGTDWDIFYKYFNGISWSNVQVISEPIVGLNTNVGCSDAVAIAVENGMVYVVWNDDNHTNGAGADWDIFYRCYNGNSWSKIEVISEPIPGENINTRDSLGPAIAVENGNVYVVWQDTNNTNGAGNDFDIFYRHFDGNKWLDVEVISEPIQGKNINIKSSHFASIAVENGNVYAVWEDINDTNGAGIDGDIFYRHFDGSKWLDIEVISEPIVGSNTNIGSGWDFSNKITVENGKVYVVWAHTNNTNGAGTDHDIFYRHFDGNSWSTIKVLSELIPGLDTNKDMSIYPDLVVENGNIYVIWSDQYNINSSGADYDIFYRYFNGTSWSKLDILSEPIQGANINTGNSFYPSIDVENGTVYVSWDDNTNINRAGIDLDIFFRRIYPRPILSSGIVKPLIGYTYTYFNYTVKYFDEINKQPIYIHVNIDSINYTMKEVDSNDLDYWDGKDYFFNTTLNISTDHTFQFFASPDGYFVISTNLIDAPDVFNSPPIITTIDNITAYEDTYYGVDYEYTDMDIDQTVNWSLTTNASSWLKINSSTGILNGTPLNNDVGTYWVNVSVIDNYNGLDFHNFTLTVIDINDNPIITTSNLEITYEDELYMVDYNATDIDDPMENQIWTLNTNASSWLDIDSDTGVISGTPTNDDIGRYWVNVVVDDGEGGSDFINFTLIVLNVNDPPMIITEDVITATIAELYKVDYEAIDIDPPPINLIWSLNTNATWLTINVITGVLEGTPVITDLGWYNVNVSVDDGEGGQDWHEFILTVIRKNLPPIIITTDVVLTMIDVLYQVDYEAIDDWTPVDELLWMLKSNASWLNIETTTGILSGIPNLYDVGWYWVNVSVSDRVGGFGFHNFMLRVSKGSNNAPELSNPKITPSEGDTETEFTFLVHYYDEDGDTPTFIQAVINNKYYNMTLKTSNASNGTYEYSTKLSEGIHTYYFTASDGLETVKTDNFTIDIEKVRKISEESSWAWLIYVIIVLIIITILIMFIIIRRKKREEEERKKELLPPTHQAVSPVVQPVESRDLEQPEQQFVEEEEELEE